MNSEVTIGLLIAAIEIKIVGLSGSSERLMVHALLLPIIVIVLLILLLVMLLVLNVILLLLVLVVCAMLVSK